MEVVASLDNSLRDALFSLFEVGTRIVNFLYADFAVNLENAVVVGEHMVNDGMCESVLSVCVNVHFDNAVLERFFDVFLR